MMQSYIAPCPNLTIQAARLSFGPYSRTIGFAAALRLNAL